MGGNIDKKNILYYFKGQAEECHFFCMFADICSYLYDDDHNVFLSWSNNKYDNSDRNILDSVFNQNLPEQLDLIEYGPNVTKFKSTVKNFFDSKPSQRDGVVSNFNEVFFKTFNINGKLQDNIDFTHKKFNKHKTLGVHIRRSDVFKLGYFSPFIRFDPNDMENYYKRIKDVFEYGSYEKIFLCTEDKTVLDFIVNKFHKDVIIYNDVYRGIYENIDKNVSQENMYTLDRRNNGEKLLLEILSDVFIASKCDGFLGSQFSGVSIFIELFNNNKFKEISYF